ncbi:MAG TPA: hypothetical protein PLY97_08485 [Acidocella sp.]|nr:hypothetical protein [Acidocella sp.]
MFDGLMSAAKAQSDLARTMFAMDHSEWPNLMTPGTANDAARRWLTGNVEKLDAVRLKYRQMDDSLTASFLAAAESLIDGLIPESPHLSDATKTTIPVEKKSATTAKEKVAAQ